LLAMRVDQVMEGVAGNREHRLAVALGVVQAVQQVYSAGPRCGQTDAQPPGVFGVTTGGESSRLLVADLNKLHPILMGAQGFEDAVDPVAWESEDRVNAP